MLCRLSSSDREQCSAWPVLTQPPFRPSTGESQGHSQPVEGHSRACETWRPTPQDSVSCCTPRRAASGETKPANALILDLQPLDLWESELGLFKTLGLWLFIMAALQYAVMYEAHVQGFTKGASPLCYPLALLRTSTTPLWIYGWCLVILFFVCLGVIFLLWLE